MGLVVVGTDISILYSRGIYSSGVVVVCSIWQSEHVGLVLVGSLYV